MQKRGLKVLASALMGLGCLVVGAGEAQAAKIGGWTYSIDSFNDGTGTILNSRNQHQGVVGSSSAYEFYGMAYKETSNRLIFAINSNLALGGETHHKSVENGKISYGDLLLNFVNQNSLSAANGSLYGVRFDDQNDTRKVQYTETETYEVYNKKTKKMETKTRTVTKTRSDVGVYGNVTTTSVTSKNDGHKSVEAHTKSVSDLKGSASYGHLAADTTYFNQKGAAQTTIAKGSLLGGVSLLSSSDLSAQHGLNFGQFGTQGAHTFGIAIDKSLLPKTGTFLASLFAECGNDGIVLKGEVQSVPEPTTVAGTLMAGAVLARRLKRRQKKATA
ncbi:XDD3 family exosortase-dependent surface protein [Leptolyngbya sp. AN02str]|uniref:XDD3 family exosortase-dependent surface protein n=1 Tax=Leptolyngbya sp. AN02str TaxID=3423363 RepID=UPI003D312D1B